MTAYADESIRQIGSGLCYAIGAAVVVTDDEDEARRAIRKLVLPRQEVIHWRDENRTRRAKIIEALADLDLLLIGIVHFPIAPKRTEMAQQRCLEDLAGSLNAEGLIGWWSRVATPARTVPTTWR